VTHFNCGRRTYRGRRKSGIFRGDKQGQEKYRPKGGGKGQRETAGPVGLYIVVRSEKSMYMQWCVDSHMKNGRTQKETKARDQSVLGRTPRITTRSDLSTQTGGVRERGKLENTIKKGGETWGESPKLTRLPEAHEGL